VDTDLSDSRSVAVHLELLGIAVYGRKGFGDDGRRWGEVAARRTTC